MHEHKRGDIRDNALAALVTSPMYRTRKETKKTGKGSYRRYAKHKAKNLGSFDKSINDGFIKRPQAKTQTIEVVKQCTQIRFQQTF